MGERGGAGASAAQTFFVSVHKHDFTFTYQGSAYHCAATTEGARLPRQCRVAVAEHELVSLLGAAQLGTVWPRMA